jgi:hypothetical protein
MITLCRTIYAKPFCEHNINHDEFYVNGYFGCKRCGEYDKQYIIITRDGRNITHVNQVPRRFVMEYYTFGIVICGRCSDKFGYESIRRGDHSYSVLEDFEIETSMTEIELVNKYFGQPEQEALNILESIKRREGRKEKWEKKLEDRKSDRNIDWDSEPDDPKEKPSYDSMSEPESDDE